MRATLNTPVQLGVKTAHVLSDGARLVVVHVVSCLRSTRKETIH